MFRISKTDNFLILFHYKSDLRISTEGKHKNKNYLNWTLLTLNKTTISSKLLISVRI